MISKSLMKYPLIMLGLLMTYLFLNQLKNQGVDWFKPDRFYTSSCRSALVMLDKRRPKSWETHCDIPSNEMKVVLPSLQIPHPLNHPIPEELSRDSGKIKLIANTLIYISQNSLNDSLERVRFVGVFLPVSTNGQKMEWRVTIKGKYLAEIGLAKDPMVQETLIAKHSKLQKIPYWEKEKEK